jgi:hypothetical protein
MANKHLELCGSQRRHKPPSAPEPRGTSPVGSPVEAPVLDSSARSFSHRLLGGRKLRFPPSNRRFAPCLPFSDFVLRPKGPSPLEPPLLCSRKSANSLRTQPSLFSHFSRETVPAQASTDFLIQHPRLFPRGLSLRYGGFRTASGTSPVDHIIIEDASERLPLGCSSS